MDSTVPQPPDSANAPRGEAARTSAWAIADQALMSIAGFAFHILSARWMPEQQYGAVAYAFAGYLVLFYAHYALLIEPMLVLSSSRFADRQRPYLRTIVSGHGVVSVIALVLFGAVTALLWQLEGALVGRAFAGMAIAAPFATLAHLARRMCYAREQTRRAASGAAVYAVIMLCGLVGLELTGHLTPFAVYVLMAVASAAASWWWLRGFGLGNPLRRELELWREFLETHWHQARFGLPTALLSWVPMNLPYLLLPRFLGQELGLIAAGRLRALVVLIQPAIQVNGALFALILPALSSRTDSAIARGRKYIAAALGCSLLSLAAVAALGGIATTLLYSSDFPEPPLWLLVALGSVPVALTLSTSVRAYCLSRLWVSLPFYGSVAAAAVAIAGGIYGLTEYGLLGLVCSMIAAYLAQAAFMAFGAGRNRRADA